MTWKPNVTVAAVIEKDGRFLFVEETSDQDIVINQPAGHVEFGESLIEAVIRETLEETASLRPAITSRNLLLACSPKRHNLPTLCFYWTTYRS